MPSINTASDISAILKMIKDEDLLGFLKQTSSPNLTHLIASSMDVTLLNSVMQLYPTMQPFNAPSTPSKPKSVKSILELIMMSDKTLLDESYETTFKSISPKLQPIRVLPSPNGLNPARFAEKYLELANALSPDTLTSDELEDCAAISTILSDEKIVSKALDALEQLLLEAARKKGLLDNTEQNKILMDATNTKKFKLLSDVLYDWAILNGFGEKTAKILKQLPSTEFQSLLQLGLLFKDNGVNQSHGAWSHFIQWFIITEFHKQHATLKLSPNSLYKMFGEERAKRKNGLTLWGLLLDATVINTNDFRMPESLHTHIAKNSTQYPLLYLIYRKGFKNRDSDEAVIFKNHSERAKRLRSA